MTPAFLAAVADTLLPGIDDPAMPGAYLPSASAAGIELSGHAPTHASLLQAIAARAGSEAAFVAATEPARNALLKHVEDDAPAEFRALVLALLADYYESAAVVAALGWRVAPPQPQGHPLPPFDVSLLAQVRRRGRIWRE